MFTNNNNYDEETKAYVLELLELCLDFGFTFDYMQHVKGVAVWHQTGSKGEECKILGRCYLDEPEAVTNLIMLIDRVKLYVRMEEGVV
jgi:hypothetical protein